MPIPVRVIHPVVNYPKLSALSVDVHTANQSNASNDAMFVATVLPSYQFYRGTKAFVEDGVVKQQASIRMSDYQLSHLLPQQAGCQLILGKIAIDGVVAKLLQV